MFPLLHHVEGADRPADPKTTLMPELLSTDQDEDENIQRGGSVVVRVIKSA